MISLFFSFKFAINSKKKKDFLQIQIGKKGVKVEIFKSQIDNLLITQIKIKAVLGICI